MSETKNKNETFTLTDNRTNASYELPVFNATVGPDVIDIRKLYAESISSNAIHGSDSDENAQIESTFHFSGREIFSEN